MEEFIYSFFPFVAWYCRKVNSGKSLKWRWSELAALINDALNILRRSSQGSKGDRTLAFDITGVFGWRWHEVRPIAFLAPYCLTSLNELLKST
jgi:hypothetical protein